MKVGSILTTREFRFQMTEPIVNIKTGAEANQVTQTEMKNVGAFRREEVGTTFPVIHHYTSYAKEVKLSIATLCDNFARTGSETAKRMIENRAN